MNEINGLARRSVRIWISLLILLFIVAGASAQQVPTIWNPNVTYTFGDEVLYNGNTYKCTGENNTTGITPTSEAFDSYGILVWELYNVDSSVNVTVGSGQQFDTFQNAWKYVKDAIIANGYPQPSTVSIIIGTTGGTYSENIPQAFNLDQNYGAQLYIYGQGSVTFNFAGTDGLVIDKGHTIANISGLSLVNTSGSTTSTGVKALDGGIVGLNNVSISGFANGLDAERKSEIYVDGASTSIANFSTSGVQALGSSLIYFNKPVSLSLSSASSTANGFVAMSSSDIYAVSCTATNLNNGFWVNTKGHINAQGSTTTGCQLGYLAQRLGMLEADASQFSGNAVGDYYTFTGGVITIFNVGGSPNTFSDGFSDIDATGN